MPLIPKAALTLGIATMIGSGVLLEAPAANAQIKIEIQLGDSDFKYRDYYWNPYSTVDPGYYRDRYYYGQRYRQPNYYFRDRPYRNYSRFRYPGYKRSDYFNRRTGTRIEPRFNTRDFYRRGW